MKQKKYFIGEIQLNMLVNAENKNARIGIAKAINDNQEIKKDQ